MRDARFIATGQESLVETEVTTMLRFQYIKPQTECSLLACIRIEHRLPSSLPPFHFMHSNRTSSKDSLRAATSLRRSLASCCAAASAAAEEALGLPPPLEEEEDWAIACSSA